MDLSPEIRNMIYPLVLKYEVVLQRPPVASTDESLITKHIGILNGLQQAHREASALFYAVNAFTATQGSLPSLKARQISHILRVLK
jgi:hypothetical protein